ncbi:branched-chain amino acid ABC transporter permease [Micromonospora sp. NPDC005367]|uniref:branched-chain amino acid ABC transporter permease n=1 Tax=Micromonospora sp. NPDC005367 TaxID=3155590 RepID=UPI0033B52A10
MRSLRTRATGYVVFVAVLLTVPAVFTRVPFFTMSTAVVMALFALGALGLVPLTGHANQISLGQAAFYGIGGYTSAILTTRHHVTPVLGILAGALIAGVIAWLMGLAIFRVQGHYFALATLGIGVALTFTANQLSYTGRNAGIADLPPLTLFGHRFTTDLSTYYLVAAVLLLAVVLVDAVLRSSLGRSLTAAGDSPVAAAGSGVDIAGLRRTAFVLAAVLAAVAGGFYAHWYRYVDPNLMWILNSVQLLLIATVGGPRSVWGAPLGAFTVITLAEASKLYVPVLVPNASGNYELVVYGVALIVALLFLPTGVAGGASALARRVAGARRRAGGAPPASQTEPDVGHAPTGGVR